MTTDPIEKRRLAALKLLGILDTPPEERFDRLGKNRPAVLRCENRIVLDPGRGAAVV